ncbi:hypothetical protein EYF80_061040 [Liparis tanakae]|uniref:Uncharacterized protein n=1 Tax=Liparis tanakae TaxID=230148 RepID=A0A4Z2EKD5_9TELE|nr:hypothetical protein EYF80_061040 [Liparis tanakae]
MFLQKETTAPWSGARGPRGRSPVGETACRFEERADRRVRLSGQLWPRLRSAAARTGGTKTRKTKCLRPQVCTVLRHRIIEDTFKYLQKEREKKELAC